jgi:hypothetical protein
VLPHDTEISTMLLPSRLAQSRVEFHHHRPTSQQQPQRSLPSDSHDASSSSLLGKKDVSATAPVWCATSFMVTQAAEVAKYEREVVLQMRENDATRERKWALMRAREAELNHRSQSETIKKKKLREARVAALLQLREFHEREREMLSYVERQDRTGIELNERRIRSKYFLAYGVEMQEIQLLLATESLKAIEAGQRVSISLEILQEFESRMRNFTLRISVQDRTIIFAQEKGSACGSYEAIAGLQFMEGRSGCAAPQRCEC